MWKINITLCLVSCMVAIAIGTTAPQTYTSVLDSFPDKLKIDPYVRIGNKLYHFGQSKVSWYKASLKCRSMGGFLASFDNQEEMTQLSDYITAKYPTDRSWWLSGSDLHSEGDFYWYTTGERISFNDWCAGQPDNDMGIENCIQLVHQISKYSMNDYVCHETLYYICETEPPKTVVEQDIDLVTMPVEKF